MKEIRFEGGAMHGKRGRDSTPPERVTFMGPPGAGGVDVYELLGVDEDGTLIYRKKN